MPSPIWPVLAACRIVSDEIVIEGEQKPLDLYLIAGPDAKTVLTRYTALVGRMALPPRWAIGYHQSRWSYGTEEQVRLRSSWTHRDFL